MVSTNRYFTIDQIEKQDFEPRRIPYDVKNYIKSAVPVQYRVWDDSDKTWWIHRDYLAEVDKLVHRYTASDVLTGLNWHTAWMALYLRPGAPEVVINAACDALLGLTDDPGRRTRLETARKIVLEW